MQRLTFLILGLAQAAFLAPAPAATLMAHQVEKGTSVDDNLINLGTAGRDFIKQYSYGGQGWRIISG